MVIIVGYTETPEGRAALARAEEEALLRDGALRIVRSMRLGVSDAADQGREWSLNVERAQVSGDELAEGLRRRGIDAIFDVDTTSDSATEALLNAAREHDAQLIVIGVRRRSPLGKLVLGSVSQDVILRAECPVLAVKAAE